MIQLRTIIPISLFKKNTTEYLSKLDLGEEAIMLTVHGHGAFVIQHVNNFMRLAELAEVACHHEAVAGMLREMNVKE